MGRCRRLVPDQRQKLSAQTFITKKNNLLILIVFYKPESGFVQPGCLPRKQRGGQTGALKYSVEGERFVEIGTKTEVPGLYPGSGPKPITVADVVFAYL